MAEDKVHGIYIKGKSNGTTSWQDRNQKFNYSAIVVIPGSEFNLKVNLLPETDPRKYDIGSDVNMKVTPRFYNGKFSGFSEVNA